MNKSRKDKKGQTLLQKARQVKSRLVYRTNITDEEVELAVAWAKGEISFKQVREVLGIAHTTCYAWLAVRLREYILRK